MASFIEKMAQHCFSTLIMDGPELLYSQTKCLCFSKIEIEKGWFLWNKRGIQYLERWQDSGEQGGWWPTFLKILLFNQSFLRLSNVVRTDDSQCSWIIYKISVDFMLLIVSSYLYDIFLRSYDGQLVMAAIVRLHLHSPRPSSCFARLLKPRCRRSEGAKVAAACTVHRSPPAPYWRVGWGGW